MLRTSLVTLFVSWPNVLPKLTKLKSSRRPYLSLSQARQILKTNQMEGLDKKVKRAIAKTLTAPQVQKLEAVRLGFLPSFLSIRQIVYHDEAFNIDPFT